MSLLLRRRFSSVIGVLFLGGGIITVLGFRVLCRTEKLWIASSISRFGSFHFSLSIWLVLSVLRAGLEFGVDAIFPNIFVTIKLCCLLGIFPSNSSFAV